MMQSIGGVVIGPAGVVAAVEVSTLLGAGHQDAAVAGHYGKAIVSVGVSRGSALGLPIADCLGITLRIDYGHGWGIDFNKRIASFLHGRRMSPLVAHLRKQIGEKNFSIVYGSEANLFTRTSVEPNIPICGGR